MARWHWLVRRPWTLKYFSSQVQFERLILDLNSSQFHAPTLITNFNQQLWFHLCKCLYCLTQQLWFAPKVTKLNAPLFWLNNGQFKLTIPKEIGTNFKKLNAPLFWLNNRRSCFCMLYNSSNARSASLPWSHRSSSWISTILYFDFDWHDWYSWIFEMFFFIWVKMTKILLCLIGASRTLFS